jgi:feruloyl esterase
MMLRRCSEAALAVLAVLVGAQAWSADCGALTLAGATAGEILQQERVTSRRFAPTTAAGPEEQLPVFCRVVAMLRPVPQSQIRIEVWLPETNWNGKLLGVGNGGFSGSISYSALAASLRRGYAAVSTNTGHDGASGLFAYQQPEQLIDFGYRAVHEMTVAAKQLARSYYTKGVKHAYWNGCSAGGRQGMQSAQRYPDDYDGIIAGAPAIDWTGRAASALRVAQAVRLQSGGVLDAGAMAILARGVLAACDGQDGVVDGVIEAPQRCRFDPGVLACAPDESGACLSPAQIESARAIYASPQNPATGRAITGLYPGSEAGWATWAGAAPFGTALDHFRFIVKAQPDWMLSEFQFERDVALAEDRDGNTINALNPDLRRYFKKGGKLLHYHGWSDPQISPGVSPQYLTAVTEKSGMALTRRSYRLFMVPGMAHCSGGNGASSFDMLSALEQWVEQGRPPEQIPAQHLRGDVVDRTRLLCAYPREAKYDDKHDSESARSFHCELP